MPQPNEGAVYTGGTAKPRGFVPTAMGGMAPSFGKGRGTPEKRQLPFARHIGIEIMVGEGDDSVEAKNAVIEMWEAWRKLSENARFRIMELRFEFITESKMALYIIYSE